MMPGFLFAAEGKKVLKSVNDDIFRFVCFFSSSAKLFFRKAREDTTSKCQLLWVLKVMEVFDCLPISNISS